MCGEVLARGLERMRAMFVRCGRVTREWEARPETAESTPIPPVRVTLSSDGQQHRMMNCSNTGREIFEILKRIFSNFFWNIFETYFLTFFWEHF